MRKHNGEEKYLRYETFMNFDKVGKIQESNAYYIFFNVENIIPQE